MVPLRLQVAGMLQGSSVITAGAALKITFLGCVRINTIYN